MHRFIIAFFLALTGTFAYTNIEQSRASNPDAEEIRHFCVPQAYELVTQPYVLLRVNAKEALAWANAKDDALIDMVVQSGNVMDDPEAMPRGYGTIGFRSGGTKTGLAFLVETATGYVHNQEYMPSEDEHVYLVLWRHK